MDFTISTSTLNIMLDKQNATINVVVFRDDVVEKAEFFDLVISNASVDGAVLDSMRFFTQVQIRDSDGMCG